MPRQFRKIWQLGKAGKSQCFCGFSGATFKFYAVLIFCQQTVLGCFLVSFKCTNQGTGISISGKFCSFPHRFALFQQPLGCFKAHTVKVLQQASACQVLILVAQGGKVPAQLIGNEGYVEQGVLIVFLDTGPHLCHQLAAFLFGFFVWLSRRAFWNSVSPLLHLTQRGSPHRLHSLLWSLSCR